MNFARIIGPGLVGCLLWMAVPAAGADSACPAGTAGSPATSGTLVLGSPVVATGGTELLSGGGFAVGVLVEVSMLKTPASGGPGGPVGMGSVLALVHGEFSEGLVVPASAAPGVYTVTAVGEGDNTGCRRLVSPPLLVPKVLGARFARLVLGSGVRSAGTSTSVSGKGCRPDSAVTLSFDATGTLIGTTTSDAQGSFSGAAHIPATAGVGQHGILASCSDPTGTGLVLNSSIEVLAAPRPLQDSLMLQAFAATAVLLIGTGLLVIARR